MKKKKQLVAGILLIILGLSVNVGSVVFRHYERAGMGPFNSGHNIMSKHFGGNNYASPKNGGFKQNPNSQQAPNKKPTSPQVPNTPQN